MKYGVQLYSFACGYPVAPAAFVEKNVYFIFGTLVKNQLAVHVKGLFLDSQFYFPLITISSLMTASQSLQYCRLVVSFEIRNISPPTLFFLKIVLFILDLLHYHMNFRIGLQISAENRKLGF